MKISNKIQLLALIFILIACERKSCLNIEYREINGDTVDSISKRYDEKGNLLAFLTKGSSSEKIYFKHDETEITNSSTKYYLDDSRRIISFKSKLSDMYEFNYKYDGAGYLILATRKRFLPDFENRLFATLTHKYIYKDNLLVSIIEHNEMGPDHEELGIGYNWTINYYLDYFAGEIAPESKSTVYNILSREIPGYPPKISRNSCGELPRKLINSITRNQEEKPSERSSFKYAVERNKVTSFSYEFPIDYDKTFVKVFELDNQCAN